MIHKNATIGKKDWGKSLLYLCIDHNRIVGLLSIRYDLSTELSNQSVLYDSTVTSIQSFLEFIDNARKW